MKACPRKSRREVFKGNAREETVDERQKIRKKWSNLICSSIREIQAAQHLGRQSQVGDPTHQQDCHFLQVEGHNRFQVELRETRGSDGVFDHVHSYEEPKRAMVVTSTRIRDRSKSTRIYSPSKLQNDRKFLRLSQQDKGQYSESTSFLTDFFNHRSQLWVVNVIYIFGDIMVSPPVLEEVKGGNGNKDHQLRRADKANYFMQS